MENRPNPFSSFRAANSANPFRFGAESRPALGQPGAPSSTISPFPAPVFGSVFGSQRLVTPQQPALFGMNVSTQSATTQPASTFGNKPRPTFTFGNPGTANAAPRPTAFPLEAAIRTQFYEQQSNQEPTAQEEGKSTELRGIVCFNVPEQFNNKLDLLSHFRKFGNVTRIFPNTKKGTATVHFDNHDSAARAKEEGTQFRPDVVFKIFWKQPTSATAKKDADDNAEPTQKIPSRINEEESTAPNEENDEDESKGLLPAATSRLASKSRQSSPARKTATSAAIAAVNLDEGVPLQISTDELRLILQKPALTAPEKMTVLDARDRFYRVMKGKNKVPGSSSDAVTLKGTCPDMCPEKERYMRVEKRRLAPYEMATSQEREYDVDHRLAVKEYSRSSADQAEPLPHELRPLPVLRMTMDYLVSAIVNKCEDPDENLGEWFNFLWDRTRGIRKDLTQQSLCDLGAVDLVEKCARFHIHCTARLCELDMQDFDQKINDENLTKCLQTLKHMYYDLSIQGVRCPNEAEFRAYDILLHCNDGDILRQAQQWDPQVRGSAEVTAALQLFSAVNSRNYVRFFRLTQSNSDYLQCCLLQRYFQQVRSTAVQIMVQAYGPPRKGQVPLANLVEVLGFGDVEEATLFCQMHGLSVEKELVLLDKMMFSLVPEQQPPRRRSFRLIESKRKVTPGEVIEKGPLPANPALSHRPHNSFDERGVLRKEAWLAEDQSGPAAAPGPAPVSQEPRVVIAAAAAPIPQPAAPKAGSYQLPPTFLIDQTVSYVASQLLSECTADLVREICQRSLNEICLAHALFGAMETLIKEEIWSVCQESLADCVRLHEERKAAEQRRRIERERDREIISSEVLAVIIDDVVLAEVTSLSSGVIAEARRKQRRQFQEEISSWCLSQLLEDVAREQCRQLATEIAGGAIRQRELLVAEVKERILEMRLRRCIHQWKWYSSMKIKKQLDMAAFPAFPAPLPLDLQAGMLRSRGESAGAVLKRKSVLQLAENPKRINTVSDIQYTIGCLSRVLDKSTLDIATLLEDRLKPRLEKQKFPFWKAVIVNLIPGDWQTGQHFQRFFGLKNAKAANNGWVHVEKRNVSICIRYVSAPELSSGVLELLRGSSCLLVVCDSSPGTESQLEKLANHLDGNFRNVELLITLCSRKRSSGLEEILQPTRTIVADFRSGSSVELMKGAESLLSMANQTTRTVPRDLAIGSLAQVADRFLTKSILSAIYQNLQTRIKYRLLHQPFNVLASIHNEAVAHLNDALDDDELGSVAWPPTELCAGTLEQLSDWNRPEYRAKVSQRLQDYMLLPEIEETGADWSELCSHVMNFCQESIALPGIDPTAFLSRIRSLLQRTLLEFQTLIPGGTPEFDNIPWTDVYQACLDYRLDCLSADDLTAGCLESHLTAFKISHSCQQAFSWASYTDATTLDETLENALEREKAEQEEKSRDALPLAAVDSEVLQLSRLVVEESRASQAEDDRFERQLKQALGQSPSSRMAPKRRSYDGRNRDEATFKTRDRKSGIDHLLRRLEDSLNESRDEDADYEHFLKKILD